MEALSQSIDLLHAKRPIQTIERPIKWASLPVGLCCSFWWSLGNATASGLSVIRHIYMGAADTWPISYTDTRPDDGKQKA